ncbi:MAG: YigZ family protein [Planctomycetota bacterium]
MSSPASEGFSIPDEHLSVDTGPECEIKVKASRFIGQVVRTTNEDEVGLALASVKKRFHDARHHCFAWRLGKPEEFRELSQDDGEPGGTAGLPILGALRREGFYDALCVVTRYFGGTKLGTGGLVRAYGDAARLAAEAAPKRTVFRESTFNLSCHYDEVGAVEAVLARCANDVRHIDREFSAGPTFQIRSIRSRASALRAALIEATAGRALCSPPVEETS